MKTDKNMSFIELANKYQISLFGDVDKDNVPNAFDCRPMDPDRDGLLGRSLHILSGGRYGQSKQTFALEKHLKAMEKEDKMSKTHFERDPDTNEVIRVTKNGEEYDPSAKSFDELMTEHYKDRVKQNGKIPKENIHVKETPKISDKQWKKYYKIVNEKEKLKLKTQQAKSRVETSKQKIDLMHLKIKEQQLQRQMMLTRPNAMLQAFSIMGMGSPQTPSRGGGPVRPGYYIERVPGLPSGYKWKKIPSEKKTKTKKKKQSKSESISCPNCGIPMMMGPGMFGQPMLFCPRCGVR